MKGYEIQCNNPYLEKQVDLNFYIEWRKQNEHYNHPAEFRYVHVESQDLPLPPFNPQVLRQREQRG